MGTEAGVIGNEMVKRTNVDAKTKGNDMAIGFQVAAAKVIVLKLLLSCDNVEQLVQQNSTGLPIELMEATAEGAGTASTTSGSVPQQPTEKHLGGGDNITDVEDLKRAWKRTKDSVVVVKMEAAVQKLENQKPKMPKMKMKTLKVKVADEAFKEAEEDVKDIAQSQKKEDQEEHAKQQCAENVCHAAFNLMNTDDV